MIYLAVPYSHPQPAVRLARFLAANTAAAKLISDGHLVFSPISHSHPLVQQAPHLRSDWQFWESFDRRILSVCEQLTVLTLDGWKESVGVFAEMAIAEELGLPIELMQP